MESLQLPILYVRERQGAVEGPCWPVSALDDIPALKMSPFRIEITGKEGYP